MLYLVLTIPVSTSQQVPGKTINFRCFFGVVSRCAAICYSAAPGMLFLAKRSVKIQDSVSNILNTCLLY